MRLIRQQKTVPKPFDRGAPLVTASVAPHGTVGPQRTLSARLAREPQAAALPGGAGLSVWDDDGRWGAAALRPDGVLTRIAPPPGVPVRFHDAETNRDLDAAPDGAAALVFQGKGGLLELSWRS